MKLFGDNTRGLLSAKDSSIEETAAAAARDLLNSSLFHDRVSDLCSVSTSPCAKDDDGVPLISALQELSGSSLSDDMSTSVAHARIHVQNMSVGLCTSSMQRRRG